MSDTNQSPQTDEQWAQDIIDQIEAVDEAIKAFQKITRNQCDEISALQAKVAELEKENDRLSGIVHNLDHTLITNGVWRKV